MMKLPPLLPFLSQPFLHFKGGQSPLPRKSSSSPRHSGVDAFQKDSKTEAKKPSSETYKPVTPERLRGYLGLENPDANAVIIAFFEILDTVEKNNFLFEKDAEGVSLLDLLLSSSNRKIVSLGKKFVEISRTPEPIKAAQLQDNDSDLSCEEEGDGSVSLQGEKKSSSSESPLPIIASVQPQKAFSTEKKLLLMGNMQGKSIESLSNAQLEIELAYREVLYQERERGIDPNKKRRAKFMVVKVLHQR